jgi:polysaccharide export outer membrane protein
MTSVNLNMGLGIYILAVDLSRRNILIGFIVLGLSACATPRAAPTQSEVLAHPYLDGADFRLEIVSRNQLLKYSEWGPSNYSMNTDWPSGGITPTDQLLAPGDMLALRIWDPEATSLIATVEAPFADLSNVIVTASGYVSIPYIEEVQVVGLTAEQARILLQENLTSIIPSAQVQLVVSAGRRNSAQILGGVAQPGSYALNERNLPLTSIITVAGGIIPSLKNPQVQIMRGNQVFRRPWKYVLDSAANDPVLNGGDRILIYEDSRSFKALGAFDSQEVINFDEEKVSVLRAVSLIGGIADTSADPRGVLVLRRYSHSETQRVNGPPNTHVVFSFDLTTADGLFSADEFLIHDNDIVLATQSPTVSAQRVFALLAAVLGLGRTVSRF